MASRTTLQPQAVRSRVALLEALRASGDNTGLVAQRTRRLLQWKPAQIDRDAWLQGILPKLWHYEKAVAALQGKTVAPADGTTAATSGSDSAAPGCQQRRKRIR